MAEIKSNLDVVTVKQLERLSTAQNMLVLLRIMFTSDGFVSLYNAMSVNTSEELLDLADAIIQTEGPNEGQGDVFDYTYLTDKEKAEYITLIEKMRTLENA